MEPFQSLRNVLFKCWICFLLANGSLVKKKSPRNDTTHVYKIDRDGIINTAARYISFFFSIPFPPSSSWARLFNHFYFSKISSPNWIEKKRFWCKAIERVAGPFMLSASRPNVLDRFSPFKGQWEGTIGDVMAFPWWWVTIPITSTRSCQWAEIF